MERIASSSSTIVESNLILEIPDDMFLTYGNKQASYDSPCNFKTALG